jgi:heat shock protein beta
MKAQAYQKANDVNNQFYATQKKTLELNPRHPLIKELKRRVETSKDEQTTKDLAVVLFETATLRSGFSLPDTADFAGRVERMLRLSMDVSLDEKVDDEPEEEVEEEKEEEEEEDDDKDSGKTKAKSDVDDDEDDDEKKTNKKPDHGGEL